MLTRGPRPRLIAAASLLLLAGALALATTPASGLLPGPPSSIPGSAFRPVSVPSPGAGLDAAALEAQPLPTVDLRPFGEPQPSADLPDRAQPSIPDSNAIVVARPTPTPRPQAASNSGGSGSSTGRSISGLASWYCQAGISPCTTGYPDSPDFDAYAAAGPDLRAALGSDWRGSIVYVDGIRVKLIDWCQCYKGEPHEKLLDLYYDVYARTGSNVVVRW